MQEITPSRVVQRQAVRVILLTPSHEILLMKIQPPHGGDSFWVAPGGGLQPGETMEIGAKRELFEELGLSDITLGPLVWRRQHTFNWAGRRLCQREQYHIMHVNRFQPFMSDPVEAEYLEEFRWWPLVEISQSTDRFTPLSLAEIVQKYLAHGPPQEPLEVEILVD
ncbi:MAG: NUDIX domain-containing protein [Candidatus Poribacteria bacterium]|nr:NUDIX domain-containing protein [Candidatus Poribacteria bacterium]